MHSSIGHIDLPPNLKSLSIYTDRNDITFTDLPNSLEKLDICIPGGTIPRLPNYLKTFECMHMKLESLPELPSTLTWLDCSYNRLRLLPRLPTSLQHVDCSYNRITELPALPAKLLHFDCSENTIAELPHLPIGLRKLDCSKNHLSELPRIPAGLRMLNFSRNPINKFPYIYDPSISVLISKSHHPYLSQLPVELVPETGDEELGEYFENGDYSENELLEHVLEIQRLQELREIRQIMPKIKEELMIKTWHPSRVEAWCGVNFSDPESD
jgi:Leucine-rich repeat (LRR) protein